MKFTALLTAGTLFAFAAASAPNPSYTNIHINTAPRLAISKSRVSSTLGRRASLNTIVDKHIDIRGPDAPDEKTHAALHYLSNAIRDASTDTVRVRSGMSGMSRRSRNPIKSKHQSTDLPIRRRSAKDKQLPQRSGMGKQHTRASQQQRRQPKFLTARQ
jgi:hypothetical protein